MPTNRLARGPWELGIGWEARRAIEAVCAAWGAISVYTGIYTSQ